MTNKKLIVENFMVGNNLELNTGEKAIENILRINKFKNIDALKRELYSFRQIENTVNRYVNALGVIIKVTIKNGQLFVTEIKQSTLNKVKRYKYFTYNKKKFYTHRVVAKAFLGLEKNEQVNHLDKNTENNILFNLERVTDDQNKKHSKLLDKILNQNPKEETNLLRYKWDYSSFIPLEKFKGNIIFLE